MNKKSLPKLLLEIFTTFFKIGCFTFGGGYAMIPLIEREIVTKKGWVKEEEVIDVFAVAQSAPGAIAINSSTIVGYKIAGLKGALAATLGVVLPSFIIITIIATFFARFQDNPIVKAAFRGIAPSVVALILMASVKVGKAVIKDKLEVVILALSIIMVVVFKMSAILVIIVGAAVGLLIYQLSPGRVKQIMERCGSNDDIS